MIKMKLLPFLFLANLCVSCSSPEEQNHETWRNQRGEYIYRKHNETFTVIPAQEKNKPKKYSWSK